MKISRFFSQWWYRLCGFLLTLLGFGSSACTETDSPYGHPLYYGPAPYEPDEPYDPRQEYNTDYAVRVAVQDVSSQPLQGAKVTLHCQGGEGLELMGDTLATDENGRIEHLLKWFGEPCREITLETIKDGFRLDTTVVQVDAYDDSAANGTYMGLFGFEVVVTLEAEEE